MARRILLLAAGLALLLPTVSARADGPARRKVVLIAGKKSHGPEGNGIHDYGWSVRLLRVMLERSNTKARVRVEHHLRGRAGNPATLDDADAILIVSDGRDGTLYEEAPHLASP